MENIKIDILTNIDYNNKSIYQEIPDFYGLGKLAKIYIETRDKEIEKALKKLGWMPPKERKELIDSINQRLACNNIHDSYFCKCGKLLIDIKDKILIDKDCKHTKKDFKCDFCGLEQDIDEILDI